MFILGRSVKRAFVPDAPAATIIEDKKGKVKGHPCTGTEALYRPYGL